MLIPVVVIVNGSAGCGYDADWAAALRAKFRAQGLEPAIALAASGEEMAGCARQAVAEGATLVVAGGGDGTVNAVGAALVDTGVAFGVLPLGTLNHFARDAGIPPALDDAIATLAHGVRSRVDVGEVNGRIFLNNSSLGIYPDIVRDREKQQRRLGRGKWPAFAWAALTALRRYPFLSVRLCVNGEQHARRTPFVFIGNNAYRMQGWNIGERARLDGGALSLYVAQRPGRLALLRLAFHALFGQIEGRRDFDVLSAGAMEIETRHKRLRVALDGEVTVMATPLRYRIRAGALTVMRPAAV